MPNLYKALIAGAAAAACTAGSAAAQLIGPAEGSWYVSGFVGAAFPDDIDVLSGSLPLIDGTTVDVESALDLETDVYFGGAIGGSLPFKSLGFIQPRIELEVSYFESGAEGVEIEGLGDVDDALADLDFDDFGQAETLFVLANSYADIIFDENQILVPYIGGGIGIGIVDDDTGFAGTTAVGLTLRVFDPLEVYAEGRYFRIFNLGDDDLTVAGLADVTGEFDFDGFTASAGARFRF